MNHKRRFKIIFGALLFYIVNLTNSWAVVVINEFLADPPNGLLGDANHDGVRSSSDDEFVEILNNGATSEDLSLWSLWDASALRHQFSNSVVLPAGERLVVFGGGNLQALPGLSFKASTGALSLNNSNEQVILKNSLGNIIDQLNFGSEGNLDQSLVRFPEGTGMLKLHSQASQTGLLFSPGLDVNGQQHRQDPKKEETIPQTPEPATLLLSGLGLAGIYFSKKHAVTRTL